MLEADGIKSDFVTLDEGDTRINVKIKYSKELDINAADSKIPENKIDSLLKKLDRIKNGDWLVLAGSVPKTLPDDIYGTILSAAEGKGIRLAVDTTGNQLLNALKYRPFLIKPNHHELGEIFGKEMTSAEEIIKHAKELQKMGAVNVLVSRGGDGAILIDENEKIHTSEAISGKLISSVGCGDSMVAGFIAGMIENGDYSHAFKLSVACSAATAFSKGLAKKDEIKSILQKM